MTTRTVNVRFTVTYYNLPNGALLSHQDSLVHQIAGTPLLQEHEVALVDKPFTARSITKANNLAWDYRRSPQFILDVREAAHQIGIPDPGLMENRNIYFYSVLNIVTK